MENEKRKRGRPRIDADFIGDLAPSHRAQVNMKYMYDGVVFLSDYSGEIPGHNLIWKEDPATCSASGKQGVAEQLGRMLEQDHLLLGDCIYFANEAAGALEAGHTSREVEKALRAARLAMKKYMADQEDEEARSEAAKAVQNLERMQTKC
ncbi:MAG: hypothetical protein LUC95_11395 [Lachnospiraceae bacterium]|nr:hypothetical protein [Lachnospiraceae bacterium]